MQMKNLSREASANASTLNTGWYGSGRPFSASMPSTQVSAENRIVVSNVGGMNETHELNGRPPMFIGYAIVEAQ
jgi:hypothetical protein